MLYDELEQMFSTCYQQNCHHSGAVPNPQRALSRSSVAGLQNPANSTFCRADFNLFSTFMRVL